MSDFQFDDPNPEARPDNGVFVDMIQDDKTRMDLAIHISSSILYAKLDLGESFDEALGATMAATVIHKEMLDEMAQTRRIDNGWSEQDWLDTLDKMRSDERPDFEPSQVRKKLASFVLRQEVVVGNHVLATSLKRALEPRVSEG